VDEALLHQSLVHSGVVRAPERGGVADKDGKRDAKGVGHHGVLVARGTERVALVCLRANLDDPV
jgi:hypothetical protein